jgi:hypothetical protein
LLRKNMVNLERPVALVIRNEVGRADAAVGVQAENVLVEPFLSFALGGSLGPCLLSSLLDYWPALADRLSHGTGHSILQRRQ